MAAIRNKSKLLLGLLALTALPLLASADSKGSKDSSDGNDGFPIENLDEEAYLGTWFQAYGSASVLYTFEFGGNCVTATYKKTADDDKIKVQNRVRPFAGSLDDDDDGWLRDCSVLLVEGFAAQSNTTDGAFTVELQPGPLPFDIGVPDIDDVEFEDNGNYWILELGPIEYDQYQWAIVGNGKDMTQLYILVRNVEMFEELYEDEVLQKAKDYGFTTFTNRPRKSNQKDCGYEHEDIFEDYQMWWDDSIVLELHDDDERL